MIKRKIKVAASIGLKIASFAKKEIQKEAMKAMKSKQARVLALKAASKMKQEAMKFEKVIKAEIAKGIKSRKKK